MLPNHSYVPDDDEDEYIPDVTEQYDEDEEFDDDDARYLAAYGARGTTHNPYSESSTEPSTRWDGWKSLDFDEELDATTSSTTKYYVQQPLPNYSVKKATTYQWRPKGLKAETPDLFEIFADMSRLDPVYIAIMGKGLEVLMKHDDFNAYTPQMKHLIELTYTMIKTYNDVNVEKLASNIKNA